MITHNLIHVFTIGGGLFIVLLSLHVISWRMFKPIKGEIVPILMEKQVKTTEIETIFSEC